MSKKKHTDTETDDVILEADAEGEGEERLRSKGEEKLREELAACRAERQEDLAGWQRSRADFVNFKREAETFRERSSAYATEAVLLRLLPVLDSFELALKHREGAPAGWVQGIAGVHSQLLEVLRASGAREMHIAIGERFDPNIHESVAIVPVENKKEDGAIVEVVRKGYTLHGKVLRAPHVHVGALAA